MDVLGTRLGYFVMIVWWSLANTLHGCVHGFGQLALVRFALGLGEGGGFPGSAKAVAEWFPAEERATAFGLFNTGSSVGAVIAPPLIALVVVASSWRSVFFFTGALGIIWALVWLLFYRTPANHPFITAGELDHIHSALVPLSKQRVAWRALLKEKDVWILCAAKFLGDSAWYFFIFWLPKYLADVRHLNIREIGYYAWVPYAFAGLGSALGGWFSSYLIARGYVVGRSRKIALGLSAGLMPVSLLITFSPLGLAIIFFSMAMFGHQSWSTIMQTLAADIFPSSAVGAVTGMVGASGSFGGMLFSLLVGYLLTSMKSFTAVFAIAGLLHPLSFLIVLIFLRSATQIRIEQPHVRTSTG
jgi:ACS family hexuronate transporter-like MFS transporter